MKRLFPLLLVAALVSAGILYWRTQTITKDSDIVPGTVDSAPPLPDPGSPAPAPNAGVPPIPSPSGVAPTFIAYLQTEAKSLDAPSVNVAASEQSVATQAASMGENEIRYARDLALGPNNPANQRILATFLLGAAGAKGRPACRELILANHSSNRAQPDSLDEMKNVQAKAMSSMCIDALSEQAQKDRNAREDLRRLSSEVKDETLRKLIQQKLRELPNP